MTTFRVNFINTASLSMTVEAETEEQATELAWKKFNSANVRDPYLYWVIGYVNELEETTR
jgi:hypothetical protein